MTEIHAVLFDFGGVVLSSPIDGFRSYEARADLPAGFLQQLNLANPDTNAWACAERGEIDEDEFHRRFEAEALARGHTIDSRAVLGAITGELRPAMLDAIKTLRSRYTVACLTNNMSIGHGTAMASTPERAAVIAEAMQLFEHVVESRRIGARKPEPRFFARACEVIGVPPEHCVFLDDLGQNLKTARALGMQTIKVTAVRQALDELEAVLGHPIR
ncbi:MAG TPA: HAD-IA family hydrolase [Kofleriaceae bacterium]